jgi:hypothetical protein
MAPSRPPASFRKIGCRVESGRIPLAEMQRARAKDSETLTGPS